MGRKKGRKEGGERKKLKMEKGGRSEGEGGGRKGVGRRWRKGGKSDQSGKKLEEHEEEE